MPAPRSTSAPVRKTPVPSGSTKTPAELADQHNKHVRAYNAEIAKAAGKLGPKARQAVQAMADQETSAKASLAAAHSALAEAIR